MKIGWMCVKCGRSWAPWISQCKPCNKEAVSVKKHIDEDYVRTLRYPPGQNRID